jgi:hypothetical protein
LIASIRLFGDKVSWASSDSPAAPELDVLFTSALDDSDKIGCASSWRLALPIVAGSAWGAFNNHKKLYLNS